MIRVPAELLDYKQWVLWRRAEVNGRMTKIPISPWSGKAAACDRPQTWSSYRHVCYALRGLVGEEALMLAQNTGMRSSEIRRVQWKQVDLKKKFLVVAKSKTQAGEGRTIPLNWDLYEALSEHAVWFEARFGRIEPDWYLFPFGKSKHLDPSRPVTTLKTA